MEENKENMKEERVYTQQEVEGIVNQINANANAQCQNMARKCRFLEEQLMFKRLDYLFKVVENAGNFSMEFVQKCSEEIEAALSVPEPETQEDVKDTLEGE